MKISHDCGFLRSRSLVRALRGHARQAGSRKGFEAAPLSGRIEPREGSHGIADACRNPLQDDMRIAKVAETRAAILAGRFHVSAEAIADRMIVQAAGLMAAISSGRRF